MSEEEPEQERDEPDDECGESPEDLQQIEPIEGLVALTVEDYSEVWFKLPSTKRLVFSLSYLVFGVSLVPWVGILEFHPPHVVAVGTALTGVGVLWFGLRKARLKWANDSLTLQRANEGMNFRFDEAGLAMVFPVQRVSVTWDMLYAFVETQSAFVLYTGPHFCFVVPKRAIDRNRLSDLRALLSGLGSPSKLEALLDWRRAALRTAVVLIAIWLIWQWMSPK